MWDVIYSPGWCPICGDPQSVCDAYGDCERAMVEGDESLRDWRDIERELEADDGEEANDAD
jgi:hypothetical protein